MTEILRFAALGLGAGAIYSLAAQGMVVIYRGSGILNFAHGAFAATGGYVYWKVSAEGGAPVGVGIVAGIAAASLLGAATFVLVIRPLRHASSLARVIATIGVMLAVQSTLIVIDDRMVSPRFVPSFLPTDLVRFGDEVTVSIDRLILAALAVVLTAGLWVAYRFTNFGLATAAVAENERAAVFIGRSPSTIALANWALGGALAGAAGVLIVPLVGVHVGVADTVLLAALAAALPGSFGSFPVSLAAGMMIGIVQSEMARYVSTPGAAQSLPFLVIVVWLVVRGRSLPLRGTFLDRLPAIGPGKLRPGAALVAAVVGSGVLLSVSTPWARALTFGMTAAFVLLSLVVVTGYCGQISLGQFGLAGVGAFVAARLVATQDLPFELAMVVAVLAAVPIGVVFALPAVRTRGANLAIVTLGLASAIEAMVFNNTDYTGGADGTVVGAQTFLGFDVDVIKHPERYGILVLLLLVLTALFVANLRRGPAGLRLIAVRTNERAAAALGITVWNTKLYAFALSAAIAGLGGVLIAFSSTVVVFSTFTSLQSMIFVAHAVIGGIGYVVGAIVGSTLTPGGLSEKLGHDLIGDNFGSYLVVLSGVGLIVMMLQNPNGITSQVARLLRLDAKARKARGSEPPHDRVEPVRVEPHVLEVRDMTVRFGGVVALDGPSLRLEPGKVLGLIGPNGAGKTTLIDAVTGFVRPASGDVLLDGTSIVRTSVAGRARMGISRSFQSLELFEDLTVEENLRAGAECARPSVFLSGLLFRRPRPLPAAALTAASEFGLLDQLGTKVNDLSYGTRRLVAIARAISSQPSLLLLDEPASGLGDHQSRELAVLLRHLASSWGMAILVIEHDMEFVMGLCDHIAVLNFGACIMEGAPAQVRRDASVIAAYLGDLGDSDAEEGLETPAGPRVGSR
jgi:sulfate-transporting ATPase